MVAFAKLSAGGRIGSTIRRPFKYTLTAGKAPIGYSFHTLPLFLIYLMRGLAG